MPEWWRADTGGGYLRAGIIEGATALRRSFYYRVSYRRRNRVLASSRRGSTRVSYARAFHQRRLLQFV